MQRAGAALGEVARPGDLIALQGDLGAGKTTFVQGLARGLGVHSPWVSSPTFTIMNEHPGRLRLLHMDFYRLERELDFREVGIDEALNRDDAVIAVEWFDRLQGPAPPPYLELRIQPATGGQGRRIFLAATGERPRALALAWLERGRRV